MDEPGDRASAVRRRLWRGCGAANLEEVPWTLVRLCLEERGEPLRAPGVTSPEGVWGKTHLKNDIPDQICCSRK